MTTRRDRRRRPADAIPGLTLTPVTTAQVTSEPEDRVLLSPSDRYAIVGKTGCGKTTFTTYLAATIVPQQLRNADWQVWWFDTKGDPKDVARLQKNGYVEGDPATGKPKQHRGRWRGDRPPALLYFRIRIRDRGEGLSIVDQVQQLYRLALRRRRVLCVADEFGQVVVGPRTAGRAMDDVLTRGRGLGVGNIGETQEPVDIPRKLLSQAQHLFLFDLSFPRDIKYVRELLDDYRRPEERHAFFHLWLDGDSRPRYYPSLRAWRSGVIEGTGS